MDINKVDLYRQVFHAFKKLCADGKQTCSFRTFCLEHGVNQCQMKLILKDEFQGVSCIPGYRRFAKNPDAVIRYLQIYDDFKNLCVQDHRFVTFAEFCRIRGVDYEHTRCYLKHHKLYVSDLPGYVGRCNNRSSKCQEVPFENIIFEEAGFLPADGGNVITVRVDGHIEVSFPADTDIDVVTKFVKKARKEAGNVGA